MAYSDPVAAAPAAPRRHPGWRWPVALVICVALACGTALYLAQQVVDLPAALLRELRGQRLQVSFGTEAAKLSGSSYLQFAQLEELSWFEARSTKEVLGLALPQVVMVARVPVQYTYYLDLNAPWRFEWRAGTLVVYPPPIRHNRPAATISKLEWLTVEGAWLPYRGNVEKELQAEMSPRLETRAKQLTPWVKAEGAARAEEFVRKWLSDRYGLKPGVPVRVSWEAPPAVPPASDK